jgi:preprotein translocase subunit YajC
MKRLKYLLLASLVAFAACDEDPGTTDIIQVGNVQVTVTAGGAGVAGATVSLGAAGTTPQTTNAQGQASFSNVPAGTYVVTVTGLTADVICSSTTQPVTVAGGQTTGVTFACNTVSTASISGTVAFANGDPRPNATVTITRTAPAPAAPAVNVTTDANGRFSLSGLRSGTYTVSLPATTGCTTAASTQTVTIAAGEARVVNFLCTVTPPPPAQEPATVAIRSIQTVGAFPVNLPDNQVAGLVTVNLEVNEGDQRVTRVELLLGDRVVCTHDRTVTAVEGMELAVFNVACVVNTAEFNQTTGVPNFLNAATQFRARIYTVASGNTVAAATGTRAITLVNADRAFVTVSAQRTGLSTNTTFGGNGTAGALFGGLGVAPVPAGQAGILWWNGDVTIRALPVIYSGLGLQNVTITLQAQQPASGTNLVNYIGNAPTQRTVTRTLTAAPFIMTLRAADDIDENNNANRGVGQVEDAGVVITVNALRADGQPAFGGGAGLQFALICSNGRAQDFTDFPLTGCADGQAAFGIRLDNFAPVVGFMDQALRWSGQFAVPSRVASATAVGLGFTFTGVTGWVHDAFTFTAERILPTHQSICSANAACPGMGFTAGSTTTGPTAPRVADRGVGLPTTGFFSYSAGTSPTALTAITTAGTLTETFNNDVYYLQILVQDVFGAAGSTVNQRRRFYNATFEGTGTSNANITALQTAGNNARWGLDEGDPCFSSDGVTCNNQLLDGTRLDQDREIIGVAGTLTIGGGGVMSGTQIVSQLLDLQGPEGGTPSFFPQNPVITRLRQRAPNIGTTAGCYIGLISNNACQFRGGIGPNSGLSGTYDFYTAQDAGAFYRLHHAISGQVFNVNTDANGTSLDFDNRTVTESTGYWLLEQRVVDNAGNSSPLLTRTFVWDRTAPIVGGLSFGATVTAGGSATFSTVVSDELDLDKAEFFLVWAGAGLAVLQNTVTLGEFGPDAFTTAGSATSTSPFVHSLRVGAGGALIPTTGSLFRVFDFGKNVAEGVGGVPAVSPAPAPVEQNDITAASLYSSAAVLCWDTDGNGCPTNPTTTTLTFQVTGPTLVPFTRVDFLVGIDVNNDGVIDTDAAGNQLWAPIAQGSAVSVVGNVSTFNRQVTVQELVNASRRTFITIFPGDPANRIHIRAIGYRPNGTAFTVAAGAAACTNAPGTGTACTIELSRN